MKTVSSTAFSDRKTEKLIYHQGDTEIIYNKQGSLHVEARDTGNLFFPENRRRAISGKKGIVCAIYLYNSPNAVI